MFVCVYSAFSARDFPGYYTRPLPGNCRGQHGSMSNWKPKHRIQNPINACPPDWKQYEGACYWDGRRQHGFKYYNQAEEECNKRNAHIWMPNRREEFDWVTQNVITHRTNNYWIGIFCSKNGSKKFAEMYTATREDMRIIGPKLQQFARMKSEVNQHNVPAVTFKMDDHGGHSWRDRHGNEDDSAWICEAPMG